MDYSIWYSRVTDWLTTNSQTHSKGEWCHPKKFGRYTTSPHCFFSKKNQADRPSPSNPNFFAVTPRPQTILNRTALMSFDSPLGLRHPTVKSLPILYWKKYWDLEKILIFFTINTDKNTDSSREFWLLFWWFYYVEIVSSDIPQSNLSQDWKKYWKLGKIFFSRSYFTPALLMHSNGTRRGMQGCSIFDCGRGDGNFSDPPPPHFFFNFGWWVVPHPHIF